MGVVKTKALRLYGKSDLRLTEFDLPSVGEDEILVRIISDSVCMSSYKAAIQGADHKRVPNDVAVNPTMIGHEFSGEIVEVGKNVSDKYKPGAKFALQPALRGTYDAAGYSFPYLGGATQYAIIPKLYIEQGNVLIYEGDGWFPCSMAEPLSCVIGAAHSNYHTSQGDYVHRMGVKEGGVAAALASAGPMGLAMIDYLIHCDRKPRLLVVTDIDDARLKRAANTLTPDVARANGVELRYVNTGGGDAVASLLAIAESYDDVFVFAPVAAVVEQADAILGYDGCLNFFAGPSRSDFTAKFNFYNVHYNATHITGTSGGNTDDMREALIMASQGRVNPAILVTHIGGLDAARDTTLNLPDIAGGKKLIYTHISMPLTAIDDLPKLAAGDSLMAKLAKITERHGGLWSVEAETALLNEAKAF